MYRRYYHVEDLPEIEGDAILVTVHAERSTEFSQSWICPQCGDYWADVTVKSKQFNKTRRFVAQTWLCRECGKKQADISHYVNLPGSLLVHETITLDNLPIELLKRELEIEFDYILRQEN